jgi:hypothetical protein
MASRKDAIKDSILRSAAAAERHESPYLHWLLEDVFPADIHRELKDIAFPA